MLVLGCVKEVHDYHLDVSLPNGLTGRVPITAVSDGYTDLLQKLAKGDFSVAKVQSQIRTIFFLFISSIFTGYMAKIILYDFFFYWGGGGDYRCE